MKLPRLAALALGLAAVLSLPASAAEPASAPAGQRTITVTGTGTVQATPDTAALSFAVDTQADSASAALRANATAMRRVIAAIRAAGIAAADVRTQQVWLSPRPSSDGQRIVGYTASNSVDVTVRDLAAAGPVIDGAVDAGADQVSGPSLRPSDADALQRKALAAAYDDALGKAKALAEKAGAQLGGAVAIAEGGATPIPLPTAGATAARATAPQQEPTPIEPGTSEVSAFVTVTFAIS